MGKRVAYIIFWALLIVSTIMFFVDDYRYKAYGIMFLVLPGILVLNLSLHYKTIKTDRIGRPLIILTAILVPGVLILWSIFRTLHLPGSIELSLISSFLVLASIVTFGIYLWRTKEISSFILVLLLFPVIILGSRLVPINFPKSMSDDYPKYVISLYKINKATLEKFQDCNSLNKLHQFELKVIAIGGGFNSEGLLFNFYRNDDIDILSEDFKSLISKIGLTTEFATDYNYLGELLLNISQIEVYVANTKCN